jgi:hypothetical protein
MIILKLYKSHSSPKLGLFKYSFDTRGRYHSCDNNPAIQAPDGFKEWRVRNLIHREDGPATIWGDNSVEYWLNGDEESRQIFIYLTLYEENYYVNI